MRDGLRSWARDGCSRRGPEASSWATLYQNLFSNGERASTPAPASSAPATLCVTIEPRLMTREQAREYLCGVEPESIGIAQVPIKGRKVRFDRREIDSILNSLSSIVLDTSQEGERVLAPSLVDWFEAP